MNEARLMFEAMMRGQGKTSLTRKGERYIAPSIQVRWHFFRLGWEMAKAAGAIR